MKKIIFERYLDYIKTEPLLGTFARLLRHFRLYVRREHSAPTGRIFMKFGVRRIFRKFIEKIQFV